MSIFERPKCEHPGCQAPVDYVEEMGLGFQKWVCAGHHSYSPDEQKLLDKYKPIQDENAALRAEVERLKKLLEGLGHGQH